MYNRKYSDLQAYNEVVNINRNNRSYKEMYKIAVYIIDYLQETRMHHILIFQGTIISVNVSKFS